MPRLLIAECIHEVCSFNPIPTRLDDFLLLRGTELLDYHRGLGTEVSGACQVLGQDATVTLAPALGARSSTSGGVLAADDWNRLRQAFLEALAEVGPVDGAYFALHGAMAAENELDPEGYLLEHARQILGEQIPIVASYDLHGIVTERMLRHTTASVLYHTYPHVDFLETGQRAARLLLRTLVAGIRPVTARVVIPTLVRGDQLITRTGIYGEIIRKAQEIETQGPGLAAGVLIGNPFTDVPELACSSLVVADNDVAFASHAALELACAVWEHRAAMQVQLTSLEQALSAAQQATGTVVLMEPADATSSGAPGDGTTILHALRKLPYQRRALVPCVDAPAVAAAKLAGLGTTIRLNLGAGSGGFCQPVSIDARIVMLSDGHFRSESFQQPWYAGDTAVLVCGTITLVVTSRPVHLYDRSLFYAHGQDPQQFDLVVVKSPHCQPHMFADWCDMLFTVDTPGPTSPNLTRLPYQQCQRPIYPLDRDTSFQPTVQLFGHVKA